LALAAGRLAREKKAFSIRILDVRKLSSVTDYFVVCSVDAEVQGRAVADHIAEQLKEQGISAWHKEGYRGTGWILLDYIDVMVHVFLPRVREHYALEKLWADAPVRELPDEA
jgi:ribosome-associated protein